MLAGGGAIWYIVHTYIYIWRSVLAIALEFRDGHKMWCLFHPFCNSSFFCYFYAMSWDPCVGMAVAHISECVKALPPLLLLFLLLFGFTAGICVLCVSLGYNISHIYVCMMRCGPKAMRTPFERAPWTLFFFCSPTQIQGSWLKRFFFCRWPSVFFLMCIWVVLCSTCAKADGDTLRAPKKGTVTSCTYVGSFAAVCDVQREFEFSEF